MFVVEEQQFGLFNVEGVLCALANECPHAGASLAHGDVDGDVVSCRIHHWRFCIRDGTYLDEENARYNATAYRINIVDEDVFIEDALSVEDTEHS